MRPVIYYTLRGRLTVTVYGAVALAVGTVAFAVYLVAFSTAHWGWVGINGDSGENRGLWLNCIDVAGKKEYCGSLVGNQGASGILVSAQCFAILALVGMALVIGINIAYILVQRFNQDKRLVIAQTFICCICGASLLLTIALWATAFDKYVGDILEKSPGTVDKLGAGGGTVYANFDFNYGFGFSFFTCVVACVLVLVCCVLYVSELRYNKYMIPA